MFSHYINHIENTGSLEGHQTLMAHECLTVAATLGHFHRWQRQVEPAGRDKPDWMKVLTISAGDFRYKYSPTLDLLGNAQHPTYAHPKLLGRCFDNVYHQGWFIRDLPARGKPPSKEQMQKIYNQEYEEVVARIKNTLDLTDESPTYPLVPTSLCNLEIVLHPRLFWEQCSLPELPPSRMPEPREYELDGAQGLIDLSWSQRAPQMVMDDIDRDPRYSQYPYQEADDYEEEEEDMEVDERALGKTGSAHIAVPTSTRCSYCRPEATYAFLRQDQTPGSPRSIHMDTDMAMEMGGLGMGTSRSETCRVMPRMEALQDQTRMLSAPDLVSSLTKGMTEAATQILEKFTVHRQLGHQAQTPRKEEEWEPRPEMTPRKVDRGHQSSHTASSELPRSTSQKRWSQSRPRDEGEPKKGRTENEGRSSKVQVGIDWSTTGIQKPVSKPDLWHPSFKPDPSGVSKYQQP